MRVRAKKKFFFIGERDIGAEFDMPDDHAQESDFYIVLTGDEAKPVPEVVKEREPETFSEINTLQKKQSRKGQNWVP